MGRSQQVIETLKQASSPMTVREILKAANMPTEEAKHVSSIIWSYLKSNTFIEHPSRPCSVTGHMAKTYLASEALQQSVLPPRTISVPIPQPVTEELAVVIMIHKNGKIEIHQCSSSDIEIHNRDSKLKLSA